jgi:hypothetical protein
VRYWDHQINVANALTTHFLFCYFYTTTVTYNAFIADTLVLSTSTFKILYRAKNALTKESITLWLVRTVVDRFGLQHFPLERSKRNSGEASPMVIELKLPAVCCSILRMVF